jgi:hypothetical protein
VINIIVSNVTRSSVRPAVLKESGIIEYLDGEISHIIHEKQMNKDICIHKEPEKTEAKPAEEKPAPSPEQSGKGVKKKSK